MKKTIALIASTAMLLTASVGCGIKNNDEKNSKPEASDIEVVHLEADRPIYDDVSELAESADLIVIGEFIKDSEQELIYDNGGVFVSVTSTNEIAVQKVLKGSVDGDTLQIVQDYGIDRTNRLITFSDMTPMEKGDRWIFFLVYDEYRDAYWVSGDYTGRYPVPNDELISACEKVDAIRKECDEALSAYTEIPKSQVLSIRQNEQSDKLAISGEDGKYYSLTQKEYDEKILPIGLQIQEIEEEFKAEDFGLYDQHLISLRMYSDILKQFDCTVE